MTEPKEKYFLLLPPAAHTEALPLVFDSPHSGLWCPADMHSVAPEQALKACWDAYVDQLWDCVPRRGGCLLGAQFHRTYIDLNRSRSDIDPELLDQPWPDALDLSDAGLRGMGLIRRYALPGAPMYARKLSVAEIERRLSAYYDPYHAALQRLLDGAHAEFGQVWHINCHSMKSVGNAMNSDNGSTRPDMVVSDRDGTSAGAEATQRVADLLAQPGYQVSINSPYHGGDIVHKYGAPQHGRHSIQIEINRCLYMNEKTFEKHAGFEALKQDLETFVTRLAAHLKSQLGSKNLARKTAL